MRGFFESTHTDWINLFTLLCPEMKKIVIQIQLKKCLTHLLTADVLQAFPTVTSTSEKNGLDGFTENFPTFCATAGCRNKRMAAH